MTTTWNPSDKAAVITLTDGNLTATGSGADDGNVRSVHSISGKVYVEVLVNYRHPNTGAFFLGVANSSHSLGQWLGGSSDAAAWMDSGGIRRDGSQISSASNFSTGQVLRMAVDHTANKMWVQLNDFGWADGDPAAGTGGADISGVTGTIYVAIGLNQPGNSGTARFAAADWGYSAPSGFGEVNAATGSTYNESTAESGSAADTVSTAAVFAGSAAESGSAAETVAGALTNPGTVWDSASKRSSVTLSNGNRTATSSASVYGGVRSVDGVSSGKRYFEVVTNWAEDSLGVGLTTAAHPMNNGGRYIGDDTESVGYYTSGNVYYNDVVAATYETHDFGSIICVAFDKDAGLVWFRKNNGNWNNSGTANPATGTGGFSFSPSGTVYIAADLETSGDAVTLYSAASSWTYSAPSGFGQVNAASGSTYSDSTAEAASAADTVSAAAVRAGSVAESGSAADAPSSTWAGTRTVAETASAADSSSSALGAATYSASVSETGSAADTVSAALARAGAVAEAASAADTASSSHVMPSAVAETASADDSPSAGATTYSKSVPESASAADTVSAALVRVAATSETASVAETVAAILAAAVSAAEAANADDVSSATGGADVNNVDISRPIHLRGTRDTASDLSGVWNRANTLEGAL